MKTNPNQYPSEAIWTVGKVIRSNFKDRLVRQGWQWSSKGPLLSATEFDHIRSLLAADITDKDVLRFIGLEFSKTLPMIHYELISDGYELAFGEVAGARTIIVRELFPCRHGYRRDFQSGSYTAALEAVRALMVWRITSFREDGGASRFPVGALAATDLVYGDLYKWIKALGKFSYCRTKNVIEFLYAAVPDLCREWEAEGLKLIPVYHTSPTGGDRMTTLRLVPI